MTAFFLAMVGLRRMAIGHWRQLLEKVPDPAGLVLLSIGFAALAVSGQAVPPIVFYGIPAMMIVAGAVMSDRLFRLPGRYPPSAMPATVSICLMPSFSIAFHLDAKTQFGTFIGRQVGVAICVGVSLLVYRYVETPLNRFGKALIGRKAGGSISPGMPPS